MDANQWKAICEELLFRLQALERETYELHDYCLTRADADTLEAADKLYRRMVDSRQAAEDFADCVEDMNDTRESMTRTVKGGEPQCDE